jgi:hypothetical protein
MAEQSERKARMCTNEHKADRETVALDAPTSNPVGVVAHWEKAFAPAKIHLLLAREASHADHGHVSFRQTLRYGEA